MEELLERRGKYEKLEKRLEQSEERQISTTDKDARALPLHMGIVEVGYNPFGTLKRGWGYSYTLLKGKEKVSGEFALIFTSYAEGMPCGTTLGEF